METDREAIISDDLLNDQHLNYAQTLLHASTTSFHLLKDYTILLQKKNRQQKIKCGIQIIQYKWPMATT